MAKKSTLELVGSWAFIIGIVIAVVAGFWELSAGVSSLLIVLGLIVGLLNITGKESLSFVLLATALVIISALGGPVLGSVQYIGSYLESVLAAVINFVVPATIIVILRGIYGLAAD